MQPRTLAILIATTVAFATTTTSAIAGDDDDDEFYEPATEWIWGGEAAKPYNTDQAACQAGVKDLAKSGKYSYVSVKKTKDDTVETCVFRSGVDNASFEREVKKLLVCHDMNEASQVHAKHTMCHCTKGDPKCKSKDPTVEKSERCKQQKVTATSVDEARQRADESFAKAERKTDWIERYEKARTEIEAAEGKKQADTAKKNGQTLATTGFPEFDPGDFYPNGPNDVKIGMLCGRDDLDYAAANNVAGYDEKPKVVQADGGIIYYTWHHHEELGRMQLIQTIPHSSAPHTGGRAIWRKAFPGTYP